VQHQVRSGGTYSIYKNDEDNGMIVVNIMYIKRCALCKLLAKELVSKMQARFCAQSVQVYIQNFYLFHLRTQVSLQVTDICLRCSDEGIYGDFFDKFAFLLDPINMLWENTIP